MGSIGAIGKKEQKRGRGRPATGIGPAIGLRLYPELDAQLGVWIAMQPQPISRPEAIRRLLELALRLPQAKS